MVKIFLSVWLLLPHSLAWADETIDPLTWWNQLPESSWQEQPTLIRNLTIKSSQAAKARRWDKTLLEFSELGFLQYIPSDAVNFIRRLNAQENTTELPNELLYDPTLIQLIVVDRGAKVSALVPIGNSYKSIGSWPLTANDRRSAANTLAWLSRNLGYDAVVLDARDGLILAGLMKNTSELGQGLLLKQSAKRWVIKASNTRGEALLQMIKTQGSLAVFEVLLAKGKTLEVAKGSKILLGQNQNWLKIMQPEAESSSSQEP